jgi:hypothetical protein
MKKINITTEKCKLCLNNHRETFLVSIEFKESNYDFYLEFKMYEEKNNLFCLYPGCDDSLREF